MNRLEQQLHFPFGDTLPAPGDALEVAPGVRWLRMPLPFALDHVNLWLLRDRLDGREGWTVVDCCITHDDAKAQWEQVFANELEGLPILRVVVTHMHPDHLGLAHYLSGNFEKAADAYKRCMEFSKNPDMLTATTYWYYLTLSRLGRTAEAKALLAPITSDMEIIENGSYYRLLRLYKGEVAAESFTGAAGLDAVTTTYGLARWHAMEGRDEQATTLLREIVDGHAQQWPAFAYIAAEAELARKAVR